MPLKTKEQFFSPDSAAVYLPLFVSGLVLPALLIPVIHAVGYSEIMEEFTKATVILLFLPQLPSVKTQLLAALIFGFLFGLSESIFYLNNIFQLGNFAVLWERFFWTVPMHIVTAAIIAFSCLAGKKFVIFGLIGAVFIHLLFNAIILQIF